tara:strand:+ start:320 stop:649 length:330 start_codon:yes stop_codon:yes gene_type:complete
MTTQNKKIVHIDKFSAKAKKLWLKIQSDCNELQSICEDEKTSKFDDKWSSHNLIVDVHPAIQLKKDPAQKRKQDQAKVIADLLKEAGCTDEVIRTSLKARKLPTEGILV